LSKEKAFAPVEHYVSPPSQYFGVSNLIYTTHVLEIEVGKKEVSVLVSVFSTKSITRREVNQCQPY
jgi:hypothetical protein